MTTKKEIIAELAKREKQLYSTVMDCRRFAQQEKNKKEKEYWAAVEKKYSCAWKEMVEVWQFATNSPSGEYPN